MDAQQIIETLAKMEQNLQGVESARQQVQQVANAYSGTRTQLESLATNIHQISDDIKKVINAISKNQELASKVFSECLSGTLDDLRKKTYEIKGVADTLQTQFSEECKAASSSLSTEVDAFLAKLRKQFDAEVKAWNKKVCSEINRISDEIETLMTEAERMRISFEKETSMASKGFEEELSKSKDAHKSAGQAIIKDFKKSMDESVSSFEKTKGDLENVLEQYKKVMDNFSKEMDSKFLPITDSIEVITKTENIQLKQIKYDRILLIVILIGVLISIVVRFV